jgi:hypothetical protein
MPGLIQGRLLQPRSKMAQKKSSAKPSIPECPAYTVCQDQKVDCKICLELPVPEWVAHVEKVLAR